MIDWFQQLKRQYETKFRGLGTFTSGYPKSHWLGCDRGSRHPDRRIELPRQAPVEFISCNSCLIREEYIRTLPCHPGRVGWPHSPNYHPAFFCGLCDHGLDHETWASVRGIGSKVETVLQHIDPGASHPVTWLSAGVLPWAEERSLLLPSKPDLDKFMAELAERYPGHFGDSGRHCFCSPFPEDDTLQVDLDPKVCTNSHCIGFKSQFGFYPSSCQDTHTP